MTNPPINYLDEYFTASEFDPNYRFVFTYKLYKIDGRPLCSTEASVTCEHTDVNEYIALANPKYEDVLEKIWEINYINHSLDPLQDTDHRILMFCYLTVNKFDRKTNEDLGMVNDNLYLVNYSMQNYKDSDIVYHHRNPKQFPFWPVSKDFFVKDAYRLEILIPRISKTHRLNSHDFVRKVMKIWCKNPEKTLYLQ